MNLRLFIAIDMPERVREDITELSNLLMKYDTDVKWVAPHNIHLTVKFLGSTPEAMIDTIRESLVAAVSECEPFHLAIKGTGAFPTEKHPRVIWVGVADSDALRSLRDRIEKSMAVLGFPKEEKDFHPHLTLGRVRSQRGMIALLKQLSIYREANFGEFVVDTVNLMQSELKPKGAEYRCLHAVPLGRK